MKYLKLFESWNGTQKEELKKNYEKYVMDKDYIPNIIRDLIKKHLSKEWWDENSASSIDVKWEPIPFKELEYENRYKKNHKEFNNVCYVGELTLKTDFARGSGAMLGERFDMILAKATKQLDEVILLPYRGEMDDSSHGPISFRQLGNTYTLNQAFDTNGRVLPRYMQIHGFILNKDYLQI